MLFISLKTTNIFLNRGDVDSVDYEDLDDYDEDDNYNDADDKYRKIGTIRRLFKELDRDYFKPIKIDRGFDGRENNYIK